MPFFPNFAAEGNEKPQTTMANANSNLTRAKSAKKDEFYTQLADIENELRHYRDHFRGKSVLCNCDDPYESNFFKYFALNFNALGLKKLTATCYDGSPVTGSELLIDFGGGEAQPRRMAYKVEITEVADLNGDGRTDLADVRILLQNDRNALTLLRGNGDFRSPEAEELLRRADIVCTNPPFSLFREYVAQLMAHGKKFLIIGNQNAITYKEIFPLIMDNKMWLGTRAGDMSFKVPQDYEARETRFWQDEDGQKWRSLGNICWFTNLDHKKRHEELILYRSYTPEAYPRYDNYDAIEVSKTADIPADYHGAMGVPITFLDKYCPEQFEILNANDFRIGGNVKAKPHGLIKNKEASITTYVDSGTDVAERERERETGAYYVRTDTRQENCSPRELTDGISAASASMPAYLSAAYFDMVARPEIGEKKIYRRIFIRRRQ